MLPAPTGSGRTVEGEAVFVPLRDAGARRDIGLVWRRAAALSPAAARFRDFVVASGAQQALSAQAPRPVGGSSSGA